MVAAANSNAQALAAERDRAFEDLEGLRSEAEAADTLAAQDIAGLDETIADLQAQLDTALGGASSGEGAADIRAVEARVEELEAELSRREAFSDDEAAELRARCELAETDLGSFEELRQEADELREALRRAETRLAAGGAVSTTADSERMAMLEAQVAELLWEVDSLSQATAELMVLRPKAVMADRYARLLREAGIEPGDGVF